MVELTNFIKIKPYQDINHKYKAHVNAEIWENVQLQDWKYLSPTIKQFYILSIQEQILSAQ